MQAFFHLATIQFSICFYQTQEEACLLIASCFRKQSYHVDLLVLLLATPSNLIPFNDNNFIRICSSYYLDFSQKKKIKASYYTSLNLFQSMMHLQKSFCLWNCINCNNLKMYYFCRIKKRKLKLLTYTGFKNFSSLLSPTVAISFHCLMNFITESS